MSPGAASTKHAYHNHDPPEFDFFEASMATSLVQCPTSMEFLAAAGFIRLGDWAPVPMCFDTLSMSALFNVDHLPDPLPTGWFWETTGGSVLGAGDHSTPSKGKVVIPEFKYTCSGPIHSITCSVIKLPKNKSWSVENAYNFYAFSKMDVLGSFSKSQLGGRYVTCHAVTSTGQGQYGTQMGDESNNRGAASAITTGTNACGGIISAGGVVEKRMACQHGRQRSECEECKGGGSICEHGRRRSRCKECGGGSICKHGRQRNECEDCGGGSICGHGRRPAQPMQRV